MDSATRHAIYTATARIVALIGARDGRSLKEEFGMPEPVAEELFEVLAGYVDDAPPAISAPPHETAFGAPVRGKIPVDIYAMNAPATWGVDCSLWIDGAPVEPVLHLRFANIAGRLTQQHQNIES